MPLTLASNAITFTDNTSLSSGVITSAQLSADVQTRLVPVGAVMSFALSSTPDGWLPCNGASLTTAAYPALFNVIRYAYGGSGANFNIPDLRGIFVRGAGNQIISGTTYTGTFAQSQRDQIETITGSFRATSWNSAVAGAFTQGALHSTSVHGAPAGWGNDRTFDFNSANGGAKSGTETRPANIALHYCIKWN